MKPQTVTRLLWLGCAMVGVLGGVLRILQHVEPSSYWQRMSAVGHHPLNLVADAVALFFCVRITADHGAGTWMRLSWWFMSGSCAASLVRHAFEITAFQMGWMETMRTTLFSLRQIPIALSMALLAASLIAMKSSFARLGLGNRLRWMDITGMTGVVLILVPIFLLRAELTDSQSAYPAMRFLQAAGPFLLALTAIMGLLVHRSTTEMEGGQLLFSLRLLLISVLSRLVAMLVLWRRPVVDADGIHWLAASQIHWTVDVLATTVAWAAPWLFALAITYRWVLTISACELANHYEQNAKAELAELTESSAILPVRRWRSKRGVYGFTDE